MKNNMRYKDNFNNTSVIFFFYYFAWENFQWGFCDVDCSCSFIFVLHFVVDVLHFFCLHFVVSLQFRCCSSFIAFQHHPSLFHRLWPVFCTHFILTAQPIAEWFVTVSFEPFWDLLSQSYRALRFWVGIFYLHAFFTLRSFSDILPALIKALLGASSPSLKFERFHTNPWNTDPAHLFVWFTVIYNLPIQDDSFLNPAIHYHELLVVKV